MTTDLPIKIYDNGDDDPLLNLRQEIIDARVRMNAAVQALEVLEAEVVVQRQLIRKIAELNPDIIIEIAQSIIQVAEDVKDE